MTFSRSWLAALAGLALTTPAFADSPPAESLPAGAKVVALDVRPAAVELSGPFAYAQLLVTAKLDSGETADVTRIATLDAPAVVKLSPTGVVRPAADGTGSLTVAVGGQTAKLPVTVKGQAATPTVSFVKDVQPVLSKTGCNQGTCHGAAQGKVGFKLSLRGYDPVFDHRSLTDDLESRRFNRAAPDRSLMLMKPAGAVPHVGGVLFSPGEPYYELVKAWIADGVKQDLAAPKVTGIEVFPKNPTLSRIGMKQQFAVVASYADGSKRDVSQEVFVETSNGEVATVDKAGLMTAVRRGEATMLARYEGAYAASTVIVTGDRSGFAWTNPPTYNWIDTLVDAKLKKVKVAPSGLCDDAEFVRRVHIDLTGLPPTSDDVRKFLADVRPTQIKRDALVDTLVGSDAFVEHWANKWADLLQVNRKFLGDVGATALRKWIRDAVAKNMPYDQFVYAVLTGSGSNVDNPPASYYKILRTPDAIMENTTQLFLAVRFNCNKCHDHPFEKWTQDQYYQLSAYFAQVSFKEDPKFKGQKVGGSAVEGAKPLAELVEDGKSGEVKHERTGAVTPPVFPYPHASLPAADLPRRVQLAKWVTSADNPYFARSYVNRVWSYLLGVGIIEPVDDIRAGNPPTNPELLDRLTKEFVAGGFDTRAIIKTICKSRTYQLSIATNPQNADDEINFSHATARRLPAEVLFDSIHRATGSVSHIPGLAPGSRATQLVDSKVDLPGGFLELFGKPVRESACECERSNSMMLGPVLAMVNGPIVADAVRDASGRLSKFAAETEDDARVVEEVYLSVLNRYPTKDEVNIGLKALKGAALDHARMADEYTKRKAAFDEHVRNLAKNQQVWEDEQRKRKPTAWITLELTDLKAKSGATFTKQPDGSYLVSGKIGKYEEYTFKATTGLKTVTGLRLELLPDPSLPANGPGRAANGNLVLNEMKVTARPVGRAAEQVTGLKFDKVQATFQQDGFVVTNVIDGDLATGWALMPQFGKPHAAIFPLAQPAKYDDGVQLTFSLDQRFPDGMHTLGRFRLSVTADAQQKLKTTIDPNVLRVLEAPVGKRTVAQVQLLQKAYYEQDSRYRELHQAIGDKPADARSLGVQDLVWALINSPAFLFNH